MWIPRETVAQPTRHGSRPTRTVGLLQPAGELRSTRLSNICPNGPAAKLLLETLRARVIDATAEVVESVLSVVHAALLGRWRLINLVSVPIVIDERCVDGYLVDAADVA